MRAHGATGAATVSGARSHDGEGGRGIPKTDGGAVRQPQTGVGFLGAAEFHPCVIAPVLSPDLPKSLN